MAAASGSPDPGVNGAVERDLREHAGEFDFFQAGRVVGLLQEPVRFSAAPARAFPPSAIAGIDWDRQPPRMSVNFMGLTGPSAVLPDCYADLVNDRLRARDGALAEFLDIFHHRALSLFYDAWEKYRFAVRYERDGSDPVSQFLLALIGLGTPGLQDRMAVPDEDLLFYAGLLSMETRSASALAAIIEDYFGVPAAIEQFAGSWVDLERADLCDLDDSECAANRLGAGALAGDALWDPQGRIRIRLGPMPAGRYLEFLPGAAAHERLRALVSFFASGIEAECQLILKREDAPACELGCGGETGARLGWFTWMKSDPSIGRDPQETVLLLSE